MHTHGTVRLTARRSFFVPVLVPVLLALVLPACDPVDDTASDDAASDDTASDDTASDDTAGDDTASDDTAGDDTAGDDTDPIAIAGTWIETYPGGMVTHTIDDTMWTLDDAEFGPTAYALDRFDNAAQTAIGGDGTTFVKLQWTYTEAPTQLWYCTVAFGQPSADAAAAVPDADVSDPTSGGCGDFAWSMLAPG